MPHASQKDTTNKDNMQPVSKTAPRDTAHGSQGTACKGNCTGACSAKLKHDFLNRASYSVIAGVAFAILGSIAAFPATADESKPTSKSVTLDPLEVQTDAADTGYSAKRTRAATKTDTALKDVPQAVTVVTGKLIEDQSVQSMADLVRYVPGMGMAQGEGNRDNPIFRGNQSTANFFVDGIRDDVEYFRDFYNIDRVEILKGPNGMIFGRGGAGGVINRVTKQAGWTPLRKFTLQGGSFNNKRGSVDYNEPINDSFALRVNGVYENSDSYREGVNFERGGVNPTLDWLVNDDTTVRLSYEFFDYNRTADRGIPNFNGRPFDTDQSTFFGDPDESVTTFTLHAVTALVDHDFGNGVNLRNQFRYADNDKFYQNIFPGATNATGTTVSISGYNNATHRRNLFNQTDVTFDVDTGSISHKLLVGMEFGRQVSDNVRNTAFFNNVATTLTLPTSDPSFHVPVTFRPNATDANNRATSNIIAFYGQDQIQLTSQVQAVIGLRYDHFKASVFNNRTGVEAEKVDTFFSPRVGLIFQPVKPVSLYASFSQTYLPKSGDQQASLTLANLLAPEKFTNYEVGAKWDILPGLNVTAALFHLDRKNVAVADPANPGFFILVDAQRTRGLELGINGQVTPEWSVAGGYTLQNGKLTQATGATAAMGAQLRQTPHHVFTLWNRYDFLPWLGAGLGVISQTSSFTTETNTIVLGGYTRVDAALFFTINENLRAQLNVENIFNKYYYASAHSNDNIMPGSPRAFRASIVGTF